MGVVVYEELLGCAERSIWASTYAFFDGPKAFEVLARRMESRPTLRVTSPDRRLRRADSQRRKAGRPAGHAADQRQAKLVRSSR
jgi:hypothetical protein